MCCVRTTLKRQLQYGNCARMVTEKNVLTVLLASSMEHCPGEKLIVA
jgi:hypothetical protein